jgi:hypothetical protein
MTFGEPGVEDFQLVVGWIEKYDAHANSLVGVPNLSFGCEAHVIAGDDHAEQRAVWKRSNIFA